MRTDENLAQYFRSSRSWKTNAFSGEKQPALDRRVQDGGRLIDGKFRTHSHSGHERNHLFLSDSGKRFTDISAISGLDTGGDTRGFVLWDYDRDGWQDIALVNSNDPLLNLYHNDIGRLPTAVSEGGGRMIALRFIGGNKASQSSSEFGPRDGFGAKAIVSLGEKKLLREHRCGDGFAIQNSATMIVGIGEHDHAEHIEVRWPSGATCETRDIQAGSLLTVYENPDDAPNGQRFTVEPYVVDPARMAKARQSHRSRLRINKPESAAALQMFTTMATWCLACKAAQPQLEYLKDGFSDELQMYGVPVDVEDTPEKLQAYAAEHSPPYKILADLQEADREGIRRLLEQSINDPPLPSTIVTDSQGRVLQHFRGVPSLSDLGRLLDDIKKANGP